MKGHQMTFAEHFAAAAAEVDAATAKRCAIAKIKEVMSDKDAADFEGKLYDPAVKPRIIIAALEHMGHTDVSDQVIRRHRNHTCVTCKRS